MNTRFNPTTNGFLHVGHVYMALINEYMAHESGGRFVLRFDDNARWQMADHGGAEGMQKHAQGQLHDLAWMGLTTDGVIYQSRVETRAKRFLAQSHFRMVIDHAGEGMKDTAPIIRVAPTISPFQTSAWITAEKVVMDYWEGTDTLIRGPELLTEHGLYIYFCALFGFPFPTCYYLPRLMATADDGPMTNVSKTMGNWRVRDLREAGVTPKKIRSVLKGSCLITPSGSWHVDNVKGSPQLIVPSIERLL